MRLRFRHLDEHTLYHEEEVCICCNNLIFSLFFSDFFFRFSFFFSNSQIYVSKEWLDECIDKVGKDIRSLNHYVRRILSPSAG